MGSRARVQAQDAPLRERSRLPDHRLPRDGPRPGLPRQPHVQEQEQAAPEKAARPQAAPDHLRVPGARGLAATCVLCIFTVLCRVNAVSRVEFASESSSKLGQ